MKGWLSRFICLLHNTTMVKIKAIVFLVVMPYWLDAQNLVLGRMEQKKVDSLQQILNNSINDSVRFQMSQALVNFYQFKNDDSAFYYIKLTSSISAKNGKLLAEAESQQTAMYHYYFRG